MRKTLTESMRHTLDRLDEANEQDRADGACPEWFNFLRERARKKGLEPIPHDARGDGYSPWDPLYWLGLNKDLDSPETCARAWNLSHEDWDRAFKESDAMLERVRQSGRNGTGIIAFFMANRRVLEFTNAFQKAHDLWMFPGALRPPKIRFDFGELTGRPDTEGE